MLKERILSKTSVPQLIFWWVLRLIIISPVLFNLHSSHGNITLQICVNFIASFAWEFLQLLPEKSFMRKISPHIQDCLIIQLFLTAFLGAFMDFYYKVWWWDSVLHIIGGAMLVVVGYEIASALQKSAEVPVPISIIILASFGFSFFAGTIWELFEFAFDQLTNSDTQHWNILLAEKAHSLFSYPPAKFPLIDTMEDMICNTIGAFITVAFLRAVPYQHSGKNDLNRLYAGNALKVKAKKEDKADK